MTKKVAERSSVVKRKTNETEIVVKVNLDGSGINCIKTGLPFFDHMIEQLSKHSLIDVDLKCHGDLQIDAHHTMEDVGWALGKAINDALGNKKGINRYSFVYLPMDECLTRCCVDISGRPWLIWNVFLPNISIKKIETEMKIYVVLLRFLTALEQNICGQSVGLYGTFDSQHILRYFLTRKFFIS